MIPLATSTVAQKVSQLKLSTPQYLELLLFLPMATATGRSFARRNYRGKDLAFIDECVAEAWAVAAELFLEPGSFEAINEKVPDADERNKFLRSTIGYKLKEYWSLRSSSTLSFLRKKGIEFKQHSVQEKDKITTTTDVDVSMCYDHVVRNEFEHRVVSLWSQGWTKESIAVEAATTVRRIKKTLNRIERRLKAK